MDIHVQPTRQGLRYSGVFSEGSGGHALWVDASWDSFVAKWQEWSNQGLRLHDIHVVTVNGQDRWTGAFLQGSGGHGLWAGATWDSFVAKWQEWSGQGLRLHDVHVRSVGGQDRYTGVFLPGSGGHALWANATWASFVAKWQEWSGQGLRLADLNAHRSGNETRYTAAFLPGNEGHYLWANVTWQSFAAKWQELGGMGLRLVDFEMVNPAAGSIFDGVDVGESDLPVADEPFGGILAAVEPAAQAAMQPAEGYGGAELDGESLVARSVGGEGGADLPNIVAPRSTGRGDHRRARGGRCHGRRRRPRRCLPGLNVRVVRPTLYEFAGGDDAFLALAAAHHVRCLADPELNHPFSHADLNPAHVQRLAAYWAEVLGGPPRYSELSGDQSVPPAAARGQRRHGRSRPAVRGVLRGGGRRRRVAGRPRVPCRPARLHGVGRGRRPRVLADGRRRPRRTADAALVVGRPPAGVSAHGQAAARRHRPRPRRAVLRDQPVPDVGGPRAPLRPAGQPLLAGAAPGRAHAPPADARRGPRAARLRARRHQPGGPPDASGRRADPGRAARGRRGLSPTW